MLSIIVLLSLNAGAIIDIFGLKGERTSELIVYVTVLAKVFAQGNS